MMILICEEFPPHPGGVSYFSDVLAKKYFREGQLKGVVSVNQKIPEEREFQVIHSPLSQRNYGTWFGDNWWLFRKLNSLVFKCKKGFTGEDWKPVVQALKELNYSPGEDVLFFTYQVHFPELFSRIHHKFQGKQWVLYHGLDLLGFKQHPKSIRENTLLAERVIFNSEATKDLFHSLGFSASTMEVIHPFLDEEYLRSLTLLSKNEIEEKIGVRIGDQVVFTSICRLVRRKGIHFAIEIVEQLVREGFKILYLIGGNGPEKEHLQQMVQEKKLDKHIYFLGFIDDLLKYSLLKISEVFLMPNYDDGGNDFEGFGISFLEAGYFDNMVIGGNHGGAVEALDVLKEGKAFQFPEKLKMAIGYISSELQYPK